jgi:hypothetical protein
MPIITIGAPVSRRAVSFPSWSSSSAARATGFLSRTSLGCNRHAGAGHLMGVGTNRASVARERFEQVFEEHFRVVSAYALRRASQADAEEVVAETFLVAWRRLDEVPRDAMPWLLGVARRVLANQRRAAGRREALRARIAGEQDGDSERGRRPPGSRRSAGSRGPTARSCSSSPGTVSRLARRQRRSGARPRRRRSASTAHGTGSARSFRAGSSEE